MDERDPAEFGSFFDILIPLAVFWLGLAFVGTFAYWDYSRPAQGTSAYMWVDDAVMIVGPCLAGGVLFTLAIPWTVIRAHRHTPRQARRRWAWTAVCGAGFPIWGSILVLPCGGLFGTLHAAVCTAFMAIAARSTPLAIAAIPALIPAWTGAWLIDENSESLGWGDTMQASWSTVAVVIWNWEMLAIGLAWAWCRARELPFLQNGRCPDCMYDRTGISCTAPCPECGCRVRTTIQKPLSPP